MARRVRSFPQSVFSSGSSAFDLRLPYDAMQWAERQTGRGIMWHTSEGDRILRGAEAKFFKVALVGLVEETISSDGFYVGCGIQLFDELTDSQRLAIFETLATALLTDTPEMPELTAVNEAAVAAVFEYAKFEIDLEIDGETPRTVWRQMVYDSYRECFAEEVDFEPGSIEDSDFSCPMSVDSKRRDGWHSAIESLADRILWDRDFEMVASFLDEPPEKAAMMRQVLGINDNYFAVAAEDLTTQQATSEAIHRLTKILR